MKLLLQVLLIGHTCYVAVQCIQSACCGLLHSSMLQLCFTLNVAIVQCKFTGITSSDDDAGSAKLHMHCMSAWQQQQQQCRLTVQVEPVDGCCWCCWLAVRRQTHPPAHTAACHNLQHSTAWCGTA